MRTLQMGCLDLGGVLVWVVLGSTVVSELILPDCCVEVPLLSEEVAFDASSARENHIRCPSENSLAASSALQAFLCTFQSSFWCSLQLYDDTLHFAHFCVPSLLPQGKTFPFANLAFSSPITWSLFSSSVAVACSRQLSFLQIG
jgi:hypothetical protein